VSKKHGAARKRRRKPKPPKTPQGRLRALAAALNECERSGMKMSLGAGAAMTPAGVVLRVNGRKWDARMFAAGKGAPPGDLDD
jgi:hypothetical protein